MAHYLWDMSQLVYLNGRLIKAKEARASIISPGFLYGEGLFETMRAYHGDIFALDRHIERLIRGARLLGLKLKWSKSKIKKAVLITLKASGLNNAYVRLNLWKEDKGSSLACFVKRLQIYPLGFIKSGAKAVISDMRVNELSPLCRIKSFNFLLYRLARQKAQGKNADEAILLNSKGYVAEGAHSNIFIVRGNCLITPSLESGCLAGITRSIVLELAQKESIDIKERLIKPRELFNADEAFLTNSLIEIMPIAKLDAKPIGSGSIGKITELLLSKYREKTKAF